MASVLTPTPTNVTTTSGPISVEEYHRMIDSGVLAEDGQYELLNGWIVKKMTKHPPHVLANDNTVDALNAVVPAGWYVRAQNPIALPQSEPEPDVAIARGTKQDYHDHHPQPTELALVVEVAESSLPKDRDKGALYAAGGISTYWIINLQSNCVEVMTDPQSSGESACYVTIQRYASGEQVPLLIDNTVVAEIPVIDLLP